MGAYAFGILPLLQFLLDVISVNELNYWTQLTYIRLKYGHFPKASKSYLTVKEDHLPNATTLFDNSNVNITAEGKKHFGVTVGSDNYKREYIDLVKDWNSQLCMLPTLGESQPQAAYSAFVSEQLELLHKNYSWYQ